MGTKKHSSNTSRAAIYCRISEDTRGLEQVGNLLVNAAALHVAVLGLWAIHVSGKVLHLSAPISYPGEACSSQGEPCLGADTMPRSLR